VLFNPALLRSTPPPWLREGAEGAGDGVARLSLVADGCRRERGGASPGWPR